MAKRESHALEISLIVFVILTAVSLMVALGAWVKLNRVVKDNDTMKQERDKANTDLRSVESESQTLRTMLGFDPQETIAKIEESFTKDKTLYAAGLDEPQQNYRGIQTHLYGLSTQRAQEILKAEENARNLQQQLERARADEATATEKLRQAADAARQELESVRAQLTDQQRKDDEQKQSVLKQLADKSATLDKMKTETEAKVADLQNQLTQTRRQLDRLKKEMDSVNQETFDVPDGRVTWVDQRSRTAWINLGREDGLRRNLTFDVYARDENNLNTAVKKGRIEVTNVRNGHTAEAKIVDDSNSNPIMADDLIASQLWNPGTSLHFALAGRMDINRDGRDDRAQVRSLLQRLGNVIDAEDSPDGSVKGEVTIHTRYLVVGERPTDTADAKQLKAFSQLMDAAARNNVEQISVDKLVDAMGLGSRVRGAGATAWAQEPNQPSTAPRSGSSGGSSAASADPDAAAATEPADDAATTPAREPAADDSGFGDEEPAADEPGASDADDPFADPADAGENSTSRRSAVRRERW